MLAENLVDELRITVQRSTVGRGKLLFRTVDEPDFTDDVIPKGDPGRHDIVLVEAKALEGSTVFLRPARGK